MKRLWRRLCNSNTCWAVERRLAHLFGWHNDACRGRMECRGPGTGIRYRFGRRWWRWLR